MNGGILFLFGVAVGVLAYQSARVSVMKKELENKEHAITRLKGEGADAPPDEGGEA
jgi:hypothetical protein